MDVKDFDYDLPEELIAQDPLEDRSSSRLMVLDKKTGEVSHHIFKEIIKYLRPGDCLVLNNTKVIPARLYGVKEGTMAKIEILLLKRKQNDVWETLVKPGKKAKPGTKIIFGDGILTGEVIDVVDDGNRLIQFSYDGIFEEILDKLGQMPLPPYITHQLKDKNRYQTVYAKYDGSAAAPTAGLHFTKELLNEVKEKGVDIAEVTLHVGLGTFRPVKVDNVLDHHMHSEFYMVSQEAADKINNAKKNGGRIISVGTTSTRTLESAADENGMLHECSGWTDIFIYPGYEFKVIDCLITNFHLPQSTLVMLVSALAGREHILSAYKKAVEDNTLLDMLQDHEAHTGDCFFIPAGRVHSIGCGTFLVEIQQTSDLTYRIYDYNRRDENGKLRELHTDLAAEAINFKVENNYRTQYTPQTDSPVKLIDCNVFKTKIYELTKPYDADYSSTDSFVIYVAFGGNATLTDDRGNTVALSMGESILIPAETDRIKITPQGENFKFLETHL